MSSSLAGRLVLVTGGAGFIGSHAVEALLVAGAGVRVLDDLSTGRRENLAGLDSAELLVRDLRDLAACHHACRGVDLVLHLAAAGSVPRSLEDPAATMAINVTGTANLLAAARDAGVRRVVYASSSAVYGDSETLPKREGDEGRPLSPYALSKRMGEELASIFERCYGLETVGLRFFNVYGPRQRPDGPYAAVIPRFFGAALAGEPAEIYGDGEQSRDFTWVGDAVEVCLAALTAPAAATGRSYNVAPGVATTVNELARRIGELTGSSIAPLHRPPRAGDVRHSLADATLLTEGLGLRPSTELAQGLAATLSTFRSAANSG